MEFHHCFYFIWRRDTIYARKGSGKIKIIIEQIDVLRLKEVASGVPLSSSRTTTSCQEKCDVLGRDMDKEAIFELWQSDDASSNEICVVPIKGMGGNIGKTTLAQLVYNDNRVN